MGTLYIAATPIGNLEDITLRAINVLQSVDAMACEDTRRTGLLLHHISIYHAMSEEKVDKTRLISYYEQNELQRIPEITSALKDGLNIALPHRLLKTLGELKEVLGDIDIVVARELTKIHEEIQRSKISTSLEHFTKTNPKGEFAILFHP